jgi:type I restriction enzyme S subunit
MEMKKYKLGDIAVITTGFPFDGNLYAKEGVRVVRGENIGDGILKWDERIDKRWNEPFSKEELYSLQSGDIVLQMDGNVGKNKSRVSVNDLPLLIAQRVGCIRAKENIADQDFLYYIICSDQYMRYINKVKTGTSIHHISLSQIGGYSINLPSLPEQKRIASVLSALDKKIALNRQINQNLPAHSSAMATIHHAA